MAQNKIMDISAQHKEEMQKQIVETMLHALELEEITEMDSRQIASFVLEKMEKITSHEQAVAFLSELSTTWPIFLRLVIIEKGAMQMVEEQHVSKDALELTREGKIDEALALVKNVTNS